MQLSVQKVQRTATLFLVDKRIWNTFTGYATENSFDKVEEKKRICTKLLLIENSTGARYQQGILDLTCPKTHFDHLETLCFNDIHHARKRAGVQLAKMIEQQRKRANQ